jgi:D-tyrosyl-tRNA(Tyr) deacylase
MRAVVQRVRWAEVEVDGRIVGRIEQGALVLLGVHQSDTESQARWLAQKLAHLRIFEDEARQAEPLRTGNRRRDAGGLQLHPVRRLPQGRRPSFAESAPYEQGETLYHQFCESLRAAGVPVQTGVYGAQMQVRLQNDGPVTLIVETPSTNE